MFATTMVRVLEGEGPKRQGGGLILILSKATYRTVGYRLRSAVGFDIYRLRTTSFTRR